MQRYQRQYQALGSTVILTQVSSQPAAAADQVFERLTDYIGAFEQQFSRFRPDSELTRFNRRAGQRTPVTPAFRQLLLSCKAMGEATGGLYNPFILPALQQAGYVGSWPTPAQTPAPDYRERGIVPVTALEIGADWAQVPVGSALDFGGIGKGYLLDRLGELLAAERVAHYWLSLGGDILCAGTDLDDQPWRVGIESAVTAGDAVGELVHRGPLPLGIATSGITKRRGVTNGIAWHHIIDPRTGMPAATTLLTATVTAPRAVDADIYAKCIIIAGPEAAEVYRHAGYITDFSLQTDDGQYITSRQERI